ncbi:MAG TPA: ankyrin repeat domain-containing protein [Pyrinomonadaceae bacterium]|nr:ankyrin repeat domain-containing protein [Pyrinomonadaceae bacterium]
MKKIFLVVCMCLSSVACAALEAKGQGAASEQLLACAKDGDAGCVGRALAAGADANATDKSGVAALTLAAAGKSAGVVKLLLSAGAEANGRPGKGTPLCRAALFGREETVEALLGAGAKVNAVCDGDHADTALIRALWSAMLAGMPADFTEELFEADAGGEGDKPGDASAGDEDSDEDKELREILSAPRDSYLATARLLLARGADVNVVAKCEVGESALMIAASSANVEMVKELLSRGAKVDEGTNPLALLREFEREYRSAKRLALPALSKEQTAALGWLERTEAAREEIKRLLRAAGAKEAEGGGREDDKVDAEALEGAADEAFTSTIKRNDVKDLERLVRAYAAHPLGASVLPAALRAAVIYDRPEMVRLLLAWGADPNAGRLKPLMDAIREGEVEYVRMLLDAGADVNATDEEGRSALDYAESWAGSSAGHDAVVEMLKARGAKNVRRK